jgi:hypothetical protein
MINIQTGQKPATLTNPQGETMDFNKKDSTVIDENTDNFFVKKSATELAHEAAVAALDPNFKITYPCDEKTDTQLCNRRWIDSLSDCA